MGKTMVHVIYPKKKILTGCDFSLVSFRLLTWVANPFVRERLPKKDTLAALVLRIIRTTLFIQSVNATIGCSDLNTYVHVFLPVLNVC
jgi:hypothetical protein